jgi:plastocyanin
MITEAQSSSRSTGSPLGSCIRILAASAILVGGLVHLQLYFDGYRNLPDANLGRSFLLNGIGSVLMAIALVLRRDPIVRLAALGLSVSTLGAFALSRTDRGIFGLVEHGLQPAPQAAVALVSELAAVALLAATFLPRVGAGGRLPVRAGMIAAASIAAVSIVATALWARTDDVVAAPPAADDGSSVAIADFAFGPDVLTTSVGSTVTWTNSDGFNHTVSSADGTFVSDSLSSGGTFQHTFATAGSFTYICAIHPSMAGTVVVE